MQENGDAYFIWYGAHRCCRRLKPKRGKTGLCILSLMSLMFITKHWMSLLPFFFVGLVESAQRTYSHCVIKSVFCISFFAFVAKSANDEWKFVKKITTETITMKFRSFSFYTVQFGVYCIATFYREHNEPQQYLTVFAVHFASSWKCENFSTIYSTA